MLVALLPNLQKNNAPRCTVHCIEVLHSSGAQVCMRTRDRQPAFAADMFLEESQLFTACDMAVAIGGDGTIIHEARHAALAGKPVLGVNTGRLGFVAALEPEEIGELARLPGGVYTVEERLMLRAWVRGAQGPSSFDAVNDVVLSRGANARILDFEVGLDSREMCHYRADGLIFATPTGSTAYSLSAGGPVLDPAMSSFVLTPICPHSLTSRPVVFRRDARLTVRMGVPQGGAALTVDGDEAMLLDAGQELAVSRSPVSARFIKLKSDNFYQTLSRKLQA